LLSKQLSIEATSFDEKTEKTPLGRLHLYKSLAGVEGFEPPNASTKTQIGNLFDPFGVACRGGRGVFHDAT
jgi:hypothetical protein